MAKDKHATWHYYCSTEDVLLGEFYGFTGASELRLVDQFVDLSYDDESVLLVSEALGFIRCF